MSAVAWAMLLGGSILVGAGLVMALSAARPMSFFGLTGFFAGLLAGFAGVFSFSMRSGRLDVALAAAAFGLLVVAGSYSLASGMLLRLHASHARRAEGSPPPGVLTLHAPANEKAPVVILDIDAEPDRYTPADVAASLALFEELSFPLPPRGARPMLFAAQRARYRSQGDTSPARESARLLGEAVAAALRDELPGAAVYVSWGTHLPRADDVVASVTRAGAPPVAGQPQERAVKDRTDVASEPSDGSARDIVLAPAAIGDSPVATFVRSRCESLAREAGGARILHTDPLWGSNALAERCAEVIASRAEGHDLFLTGVCLVGQGDVLGMEERTSTTVEHETYFHQRIRANLLESGFPTSNVRLSWLQWTDPDVTEVVRHLAALGCRHVLVCPASMLVDSLATRVDLAQAIRFARVPSSTQVTVVPPLGDDPVLVREITQRVLKALG
ncbi:MAG: hypothetical protein Kow0056_05110 [Coriobacteriia bacterium]